MVQNKEIEKHSLTNGDVEEETLIAQKLNGVLVEEDDYSEDEDDYLDYLLTVPSLERNVSNRNMSLIRDSLDCFYTAIENRKEYQKIKEELMGELVVPIINEQIKPMVIEEQVSSVKEEETTIELNNKLNEEDEIEVKDVESLKIKKFSISFTRARFVPEVPPTMYDQFIICRRCTIFFKTKKFRKMHNIVNHRRKKVDVDESSPTTTTAAAATKPRQRIRNAHKGEPLICDLCSKSFRIKALIRSHMNSHTIEKPIMCTLCPYAGKRNYDLKKHHFVHHNPDRVKKKRTRRRKCDKCDEILADKQAYKIHMRLNHRQKIIRKPRIYKRCEKCEEAIYTKKGYKIHMKEKHRGFMFIKCEHCNRRFKTNFRLKKHKARYAATGQDCRIIVRKTGEFICEECNAMFTLKSHLSLHMRKHKVFDCEQCAMSFKSQFSLKYHEFSHLDIEPKCSHCARKFSCEQKFANHLKRKTCIVNGNVLTNGHTITENGIEDH